MRNALAFWRKPRTPNIYLDIDGVILANESNLAAHAPEFISYVVKNFPVYWLTTHCQGDARVPLQRIGYLFDTGTIRSLRKIRPTSWHTLKTEAIDFSKPFLWFDDDLFPEERSELIRHNALASWVEVNLQEDPSTLKRLLENLMAPLTPSKR